MVAALLLLGGVLALGEPVQVFLEPLADGGLVLGVPGAGLGQKLHALDGADEDPAVEDAGSPDSARRRV